MRAWQVTRYGRPTEALELVAALPAACKVLLELALLGMVEGVQRVRRYELVDEFLLHVT